MDTHDQLPESGRPTDPPRQVTVRGRRRSWVEPRVRSWWVGAIVLAVIAGWLTVAKLNQTAQQRSLVNDGVAVKATIEKVGGITRTNYQVGPEDQPEVEMRFALPDGRKFLAVGKLKAQKGLVHPGMEMPLRVDPKDPENKWTDRLDVGGLAEQILVSILVAPLVLVLLVVAVIKRGGVLAVWRNGQVMEAVILEVAQSPTAPLSRVVRFAVADSPEQPLAVTVIPARLGVLEPGQVIWLIAPEQRPERAIVPALYE